MQGGHYLHTCTTSTSQGAPIAKALTLSTLESQLQCTVIGVGASETLRIYSRRGNTLVTQISMKPSSRLYRSSKIELKSASVCPPPPECSQTSI